MSNVTVAPSAGVSTALFGVCRWTSNDGLCYGTVLPIVMILTALLVVLIYSFRITPLGKALEEAVKVKDSPMLPVALRKLDPGELNSVLSGVNELPLKTFLPGIELGELVEPCAAMGVAAVRDMLKLNRLALRDIGVGTKERRIFQRGLERKIRLRQAMQDAVTKVGARVAASKARTPKARKRPSPDLSGQRPSPDPLTGELSESFMTGDMTLNTSVGLGNTMNFDNSFRSTAGQSLSSSYSPPVLASRIMPPPGISFGPLAARAIASQPRGHGESPPT